MPDSGIRTGPTWTPGSCARTGTGDRLVRGWSGVVVASWSGAGLEAVAEAVFARHNRDDRPDGELCPSMSVGDVIVFGGDVTVSVADVGFVRVVIDQRDLIVNRPWRVEMSDGAQQRSTGVPGSAGRPDANAPAAPSPELGLGP